MADSSGDSGGSEGSGPQAPFFKLDTRTRRELGLFGAALAIGLLVVPLLIWVVGHRALGPYIHGDDPRGLGPLALYGDYFAGLGHGWLGYWTVALGPAALVLAVRLWFVLLRRLPRE
jgi:hypothetical protein